MRHSVRLWWKLVGRRHGSGWILLAGTVSFALLLFGDARSIAMAPARLGARVYSINMLVVLAAGAVAFLPVVWHGRRSSSARRFDLLPFSPIRRMRVRLVTDTPAAVCGAALSAGILASVIIEGLGDSSTLLAVHLSTVVALLVFAVLVSDVLANHVGSRYPNLAVWPALAFGLLAIQGLAGFRLFSRPGPGTSNAPHPLIHAIELRPDDSVAGATSVAAAVLLLVIVLICVELWTPAVPPRSGRFFTRHRGIARGRTPLTRKEWAYVVRPTISRNAIIVTLIVILGSLILRQPALHVAAFGLWMLFAQNIFAFDLPLGGNRRYHIIPLPGYDVVHARERAMWGTVALPVAILSVPAIVFVPFDRWLLSWAFLLLGSGMFYAAALLGRLPSHRFPRAIEVSAIMVQGGTASPLASATLAVVIATSGLMILAAYALLNRWVMNHMLAAGIAVGVPGLVLLAIYGFVTRWERIRGRLLFEPEPFAGN